MKLFILLFIVLSTSYIYPQVKYDLHLYLKVYLQGDYQNGKMLTTLREKNFIPLNQPYKSPPWNYFGTEKVKVMPKDVCDWILVQFATSDYKEKICRACLLTSSGNVNDTDGSGYINFNGIMEGNYYLIIYHRNHLPLVTSRLIKINNSKLSIDFTKNDSIAANPSSIVKLSDGNYGMISGDADSNGQIDKADLLDIAKNIFKVGYSSSDLDMNGVVNVLDYQRAQKNLLKKALVKLSAN
jgi:hypothetical protein